MKQIQWIVTVVLTILLSWPGGAQKPHGPEPEPKPKKKIPIGKKSKIPFSHASPEDITNDNYPELIESFDYPNANISEVAKAISKLTGKNFIVDPKVSGKITIIAPTQITVAEAYKAFLSALAMNGLTVVPSGKFLKIRNTRIAQRDSIETYGGAYFPNTDQLITRIIKLKYINAAEVTKQIRNLYSKDGEAFAYPPTNSIIITDYGSHIERVVNIFNQLDVPGFQEQLSVIRIRHANAKDIAELLDQIINKNTKKKSSFGGAPRFRRGQNTASKGGSGAESYSLVVADDRTNSVIVVGNKAGIARIKALINKLDFKLRPEDSGGVFVYYVKYGDAEKIANVLNGIANDAKKQSQQKSKGDKPTGASAAKDIDPIFGGTVKLSADKDTNSLIITASRTDYQKIKSILSRIDIQRDQVFVKTVIMEMNAQKDTNWGVDYYKFLDGDSKGLARAGFRSSQSLDSLTNLGSDQGLILGFGSGSNVTINVGGADVTVPSFTSLIKFLKQNIDANILSTPQIMALNNEEANIEVGQNIPISSQSTNAANGSTTTSTKRENATIHLKIKPFINPESDIIRLDIDQKIKQVSSQTINISGPGGGSEPVTNVRNIKTMISVGSGDTAVLGGLILNKEETTMKKVPLLGDIPIIGWLFKSKLLKREKRNLLVFITPKIIRTASQNNNLVDQKLNERIEFIQKFLHGRDPFGQEVDNLPRQALSTEESEEEDIPGEEPAVESF